MEDDTPVFSLVILAKDKWDKILGSNDLVRIKAIPDVTKNVPDNPYIMVGMISDIHKEGEYEEGVLLYRITGRAMPKALIDFEVGVIQEVATVIADIGWLPDGTDNGLDFSGNTAAGIGDELMERFVYKHAKYNFAGNRNLRSFFTHEFTSWEEDESLSDVTPFINYQGSLRQFLEDVAAKPFNELYFEYTSDGKCKAIMRPTPFDPKNWNKLHTYRFTSDVVVEESFGKSDAEMFSVYVVQAPNIMEFNSMDLGVYPKYHPELINKYGYRRLDAENRYLLSSDVISSPQEDANGDVIAVPPDYSEVLIFLEENNFMDKEILRTQSDVIYTELLSHFINMSAPLAQSVVDSLKDNTFNREEYSKMSNAPGAEDSGDTNSEKVIASEKLEKYTQKLFNWYCENANFYSGDIRVIGNPIYRIGSKIEYEDFEQETIWEFYVESTQHEFSFQNGYTTILGVTRGLPEHGKDRFANLWGKSEDFKGGYLGEKSLEDLLEEAKKADSVIDPEAPIDWGTGGISSDVAMAALSTAKMMKERPSKYVFGGGRGSNNPFMHDPIVVDCSSFIWWCYYQNGINLKGGRTGMTTDTIKTDKRFQTVGSRGSSKSIAKMNLKLGDLVYFDTYKSDGHVGIYSGNGKFIGAQSSTGIAEANMDSGYWWNKFNGHVLRYKIL